MQSNCIGTLHLHNFSAMNFHKEPQYKYFINNYSILSDLVALIIKQYPTLLGNIQKKDKKCLLTKGFIIHLFHTHTYIYIYIEDNRLEIVRINAVLISQDFCCFSLILVSFSVSHEQEGFVKYTSLEQQLTLFKKLFNWSVCFAGNFKLVRINSLQFQHQ